MRKPLGAEAMKSPRYSSRPYLGITALFACVGARVLFLVFTREWDFGRIPLGIPLYAIPVSGAVGLLLTLVGRLRAGSVVMLLTGLADSIFGLLLIISVWMMLLGPYFLIAGCLWVGSALNAWGYLRAHAR
jgi:hypothetical protein